MPRSTPCIWSQFLRSATSCDTPSGKAVVDWPRFSTVTSWPSATQRSTSARPTNADPPSTRVFIAELLDPCLQVGAHQPRTVAGRGRRGQVRAPAPCAPGRADAYARRHAQPPSCRAHRCRRPDRLRHPAPHRERPDARCGPARHPAAARGHAGAQGARRGGDGARGLRLPAAGRRGEDRRRRRGLRRRRRGPADRRHAAQGRDGASRPAVGQRRDLHGAGQGHRRQRQGRLQGAGGRQPGQHQRARSRCATPRAWTRAASPR